MQQHPVPQQISSYQFHLVGDMTLKQFLELAGGVVVGILFYATGLPGFIKWPLILASVAIGAAMAFVPFEDRPLEQWFVAFFRSIYSPTLFFWNKRAQPVKIFQDETPGGEANQPIFAKPKIPFLSNLEDTESSFLSKVTQLFNPSASVTQPQQPTFSTPSPQPQPIQTVVSPAPFRPGSSESQQPFNAASGPRTGLVIEEKVTLPGINPDVAPLRQTITTKPVVGITQGAFSTQATPPSAPTLPNTIVGQVMDPDGGIVEGAILEVRDIMGRPVRALRTNKAGNFMIVTPLIEGKYELTTEKDGLIFDPIGFNAEGKIIDPIAVKAKGRQVVSQEVKA